MDRWTDQDVAEYMERKTIQKLDFQIPVKTVSELNSREHWAVRNKRKKSQQQEVMVAMQNILQGKKIQLPCSVKFTRIAPRKLDAGDNLSAAFKGIRDAVAATLGVNDGDESLVTWSYDQMPVGIKQYSVKVEILSRAGD